MIRACAVGVLALCIVTLPFDVLGVESGWVAIAGAVTGISAMLLYTWVISR